MKSLFIILLLATVTYGYPYEDYTGSIGNDPYHYNGQGPMPYNVEFELEQLLRDCIGDVKTREIITGLQNHSISYSYVESMVEQCKNMKK